MIWVKRVVPILLLIGIWVFYQRYTDHQREQQKQRLELYADVTARIWVKAAEYRDSTALFTASRDSILAEYQLNRDSVLGFVEQFETDPERLGPLVVRIKTLVDSLITFGTDTIQPESAE